MVSRFTREARATSKIKSHHVVRVMDIDTLDSGVPYIVMEWLAGSDLGSYLKAAGRLPPDATCELALQVCHGLAEAHAVGIVHRDVKPANLFLTQRPDGTTLLKVLDFGVAKAPEVGDYGSHRPSVIGSPGYMSPEQLRSSRELDARSDIWSLGIVMYELVAGQKPFRAASTHALAQCVQSEPLPPLPATVPAPLRDVIAKCLEKQPGDRYSDVAALAGALAPMLGAYGHDLAASVARVFHGANVPAIAVPRVPASPATTPTTLRGANAVVTVSAPVRSTRRVSILIGLGALTGGVLGIVLLTAIGRGGHRASAAQPAAIEMHVAPAPAAEPPPLAHDDAPPPPAGAIATPAPRTVAPTKTVAVKPAVKPAPKVEVTPARPKKSPPAKAAATEDVGDSRY
jgi:hypothetical protein